MSMHQFTAILHIDDAALAAHDQHRTPNLGEIPSWDFAEVVAGVRRGIVDFDRSSLAYDGPVIEEVAPE